VSIYSNVKANIITTLKAVDGVRRVIDNIKLFDEVDISVMPHVMVIPSTEDINNVASARVSESTAGFDIYLYLARHEEVEDYVAAFRTALMTDRGRGQSGTVLDTRVVQIERDDVGLVYPRGLVIFKVEVDYRQSDN